MLDLTNEEWKRKITERDPIAWVALTKAITSWIRTYAAKRLQWMQPDLRSDFVEVCLQEASLRIFRELHQYRGQGAFLGWCRTVALHVTLDRVRWERRNREQTPVNLDVDIHDQSMELDTVEAKLVLGQIYQCIDEAIERVLSVDERTVIRAGEEISIGQLAADLNISANNVYQLRHRARRKLTQYLEEQGFTRRKLQEWGLI